MLKIFLDANVIFLVILKFYPVRNLSKNTNEVE